MSILGQKISASQIAANGVVNAPDRLTGTAAQNKALFDRLIRDCVAGLYNTLIDTLAGAGGAGEIGFTPITDFAGSNVQDVIENLKALVDTKEGGSEASAALALKADKSETAAHIKAISFDAETGVFVFTRESGAEITINTALEKVATNWVYDAGTQSLVLTLADGSTQSVSLSAFITETEFADSDEIDFSVSNHVVTAHIKPGSLTDTMFDSDLMTLLENYAATASAAATTATGAATSAANSAQSAAGSAAAAALSEDAAGLSEANAADSETAAASSASNSEAWAVGKRGGADVPSTDEAYHNNAKYWAQEAQHAAGGGVTSFNGRSGTVMPQSGDYTAEQVGLGNVPNVTTNNQTPTFTQYEGEAQGAIINSGETLSIIFGKLKRLGSDFFTRLLPNAGSHNAIYRGKNLGTSVTAEQYAAIAAGTFDDLYIGDYWVINGVTWRIAAFDYYRATGDTSCDEHHVTIVPDSWLYLARMNEANTTAGAYVGSEMYTTNLEQAKTIINTAFGSAHILTHRQHLQNAVTSGRPSGGAWYDSQVELMTEQNVYGCKIFGSMPDGSTVIDNYTVDKSQYPLFAYEPSMISNREYFWLRDVVSAADFASVYLSGYANYNLASITRGVRPAFSIKS